MCVHENVFWLAECYDPEFQHVKSSRLALRLSCKSSNEQLYSRRVARRLNRGKIVHFAGALHTLSAKVLNGMRVPSVGILKEQLRGSSINVLFKKSFTAFKYHLSHTVVLYNILYGLLVYCRSIFTGCNLAGCNVSQVPAHPGLIAERDTIDL